MGTLRSGGDRKNRKLLATWSLAKFLKLHGVKRWGVKPIRKTLADGSSELTKVIVFLDPSGDILVEHNGTEYRVPMIFISNPLHDWSAVMAKVKADQSYRDWLTVGLNQDGFLHLFEQEPTQEFDVDDLFGV